MEHMDEAGSHNWAYTGTHLIQKEKEGLLRLNKSHNMESGVKAPDEI